MNALNAIETTTNTLVSVNWELQDELNDADLMAICGGGLISALNGKNALKEGVANNLNAGDLDVIDNKGGSINVSVLS